MNKTFVRCINICLIITLSFWCIVTPSLALAQFAPPPNLSATSAREFYVGRDLGRPLVTVHLMSGVGQPGVYHIPAGTDIAQLIAYAGGATDRALLDETTVRRDAGKGTYHITELNLEKALKEPTDLFRLQDQDVVVIKQSYNIDKTLQWVSIVSAIASIVLSIYLIDSLKH